MFRFVDAFMVSTSNNVLPMYNGRGNIDFLCAIDLDRDILACQRLGGFIARFKMSAGIIIPGKAENPRDLMVLSANPPWFQSKHPEFLFHDAFHLPKLLVGQRQ